MTKPAKKTPAKKVAKKAPARPAKPSVIIESKPELQSALRSTWRKSHQHQVEQIQRFLRLLGAALIPALIDIVMKGGSFNKVTLIGVVVPIIEGVYRQMYPALGAKGADDADGVTIVPEQVQDTPPPPPPGGDDGGQPEGDAAP